MSAARPFARPARRGGRGTDAGARIVSPAPYADDDGNQDQVRTGGFDPRLDADSLVLGRYRVLEGRGKGGFGTVSVCWDPRLMRRVAIKVIPLHPGDEGDKPAGKGAHGTRKKRVTPSAGLRVQAAGPTSEGEGNPDESFPDADAISAERARADALLRAALSETRTASMLPHPNIVSMLDFEADAANAYIIMEYVEGASLAELLDATEDGLLTSDEAAAIADAVGDALAFAHENGVLHLDIKPDNILIDASGRVRLADFGMATLSTVTGYSNAVGGTIGYMPPEQLQAGQVDVRTDVFALASVMYEALTGTQPFAAPTIKKSLELVCGQLADPCALNEDVAPQAADALLTALDPDPEMRPSSVRAFADELLAGLGSPRAGRQSLAALVADVTSDEEFDEGEEDELVTDPAAFEEELGPIGRAHPRLASWLMRGLAGFAAGWVAALVALVCVGGVAGTGGGAMGTASAPSGADLVAAAQRNAAVGTPGANGGTTVTATSGAGAVAETTGANTTNSTAGMGAPAGTASDTGATDTPNAAAGAPSALDLPAGVTTALVVGLVVCVVGIAAPQLAGALAVVALVVGCLALHQWALAPIVLALGIVWWLAVVRPEPLGTGAPLAGAIGAQLASPLSPVLAGLLLTPGRAAVSAAFSLVTGVTLATLAGLGTLGSIDLTHLVTPTPAQATNALLGMVTSPLTWVAGLGWVGAASAGSALCARGSKTCCYLGICCSAAILILFQLVASRMENGGLWAAPAAEAVVAILASSILAYIVVALLGTPRSLFSEEALAPDDDLAREDL